MRPVLVASLVLALAACEDEESPPTAPLLPPRAVEVDASVPSVVTTEPWRLPAQINCGDRELPWDVAPRVTPDWSRAAKVPITGRANRYGYARGEYLTKIREGRTHALVYPVSVSGVWLPLKLFERVFTLAGKDPLTQLRASLDPTNIYGTFDDFESWLGLVPYPSCQSDGAQGVPYPDGVQPSFRMGSSRVATEDGEVFTFSCATCHASRLFGRSILGLQNRAGRGNLGIELARSELANASVDAVRLVYPMTDGEARITARLQEALRYVQVKPPLLRGLDTSTSQVALSLAMRAQDAVATRVPGVPARPDRLDNYPADSKPGNWWTLKYKNRWLLDGSVVSGNPVITNLLWNEIGRGTDLVELEAWLDANQSVVDALTAAVFAAEPVRITDFFAPESIDMEAAKRGKLLFDGNCAACHGSYQKGWELPYAASLPLVERLATVEVRYHEDTPVLDVGTDSQRTQAMSSLVQLNALAIYQKTRTVIEVQHGYVPPPLVGIWARYPYFHNNAAPSLCAVLTRAAERPVTYYGGAQEDPARDFDRDCNGYPAQAPAAWLADPEALYDTRRFGMSNQGHDEGVFLRDGVEMFSPDQKRDLIVFLQTL